MSTTPVAGLALLLRAHRLCTRCLSEQSGLEPAALGDALSTISGMLVVQHEQDARCDACGTMGSVKFLTATAAP